MKLIKEFLFRFILLIISGLIYTAITGKDLFSSGVVGFITLLIVFIIIEVLYYFLNQKTKIFK